MNNLTLFLFFSAFVLGDIGRVHMQMEEKRYQLYDIESHFKIMMTIGVARHVHLVEITYG